MSKKYYNRLLTIAPSSSAPIKCTFGMNILKKFGWTEGKGLGKDEEGITECLKVTKRQEFLGLGASDKNSADNAWSNWWENLYDDAAKKLSLDKNESDGESTTSTEKSDESRNKEMKIKSRKDLQKGKLERIEAQDKIFAEEKAKQKHKKEKKVKREETEEEKEESKEEEKEKEEKQKKEKKNKKRREESKISTETIDGENVEDENEQNFIVKEKKKKKKKKDKNGRSDKEGYYIEEDVETSFQSEGKEINKKLNKQKKRKFNEENNEEELTKEKKAKKKK